MNDDTLPNRVGAGHEINPLHPHANLLSASQYRSSLVSLIALRLALLVSRVEGTISLELKEIYLKLSVLHSRALESALRMSTTKTTARDIKYSTNSYQSAIASFNKLGLASYILHEAFPLTRTFNNFT